MRRRTFLATIGAGGAPGSSGIACGAVGCRHTGKNRGWRRHERYRAPDRVRHGEWSRYVLRDSRQRGVPLLPTWRFSNIDTDFAKVLPPLAANRRIISVEQQAHGHTADIDRPLSYEQMADDTAALLRHLNIDQVDVFGYSFGSAVGLQLAVRHLGPGAQARLRAGPVTARRPLSRGTGDERKPTYEALAAARRYAVARGLRPDCAEPRRLGDAGREEDGDGPQVAGMVARNFGRSRCRRCS